MTKNSSQKSALILFSVLSAIVSTTILISIIARGYIPEYDNGLKIKATGLLSATSLPKNASIYINDKLYTTTDNTINLVPTDYQLKIVKDGYLPWNKKITIQKEMVTQADATLFKTNPLLIPLISENIINPTSNSNLTQIIFAIPSSTSSVKPGIYLIEANYYLSLVSDQYQPKYIAPNPFSPTDKTISFTFSPNSKQVILKSTLKKSSYLIDLDTGKINQQNEKNSLNWETQTRQIEVINLNKLPKIFLSNIATNPASVSFSTDENKILYTFNNQYFTYDIEKDINYKISSTKDIKSPFWLPKSNSIIYISQNEIKSIEYDNTNNNTIYTNNLPINSIIPQHDGNKLIITSNNSIFNLNIR